jgi:hypothetical protein
MALKRRRRPRWREIGPWKLGADAMGDYVHATIVGSVLRRAFLRCG